MEHHISPDLCVRGDLESTQKNFAIIIVILHMGFDVLYLDFDLIFSRTPGRRAWKLLPALTWL
jgi:hypothetical protein